MNASVKTLMAAVSSRCMEFVKHPWLNDNSIEKRQYQENIAKTAIKGNTLCVIPTGLGKTNVSALVVAERLQSNHEKKILFMAPTKPLVEQHRKSFAKMFKIGEDELKVVTGANKPEERAELYKKAWIAFSTPQTIANDVKKGRLALNDYSLLIFDEAHRAVGNYAYPYVAKVYMNQCKNPLVLALTASPGGQRYKIDEVKEKLFIKFVEIRTRDDEDVKPYVQAVHFTTEEVELADELKRIKKYMDDCKEERMQKLMKWGILNSTMAGKAQIIRIQQALARRRTGHSFMAISRLAEVLKIDHALLLLETQTIHALNEYLQSLKEQETKAAERLFKDEKFIAAIALTKQYYDAGKEHPKISKLQEIVRDELEKNKYTGIIIFAQFRDTISRIIDSLQGIKNAAPVEFIGQQKKKGKGLSQKEQVQILNEFRMGFYNILVASQVAEEGLDIEETNTVIFYEPVPSAIRRVQRTGRTARTHPGNVIVLITKDTRDEAYHWSGHHKEKKMKKVLQEMQKQRELKEFAGNGANVSDKESVQ